MGCQTVNLDPYFPVENNRNVGNLRDVIDKVLFQALKECPDTLELMNFYGKLSPQNVTNESVLRELSWIAYAGGFRYDIIRKYWPKISEAFFGFDVTQVALLSKDLDKHAQSICQTSGFKNLRKAKWCILNAKRIMDLDHELEEQGGLRGYFVNISKMDIVEIINMAPSMLKNLKFKGIGRTTIFHLLKNVGIDIFKPDIHVCRILHKLGLISEKQSISEVCHAMCSLSLSYGIKVSELDTLFFVYGKTTADYIPHITQKDAILLVQPLNGP